MKTLVALFLCLPCFAGYSFYRTVTIAHTQVPANQTNFTVKFVGTYSYLATTGNGGNLTSSSGYDVGFFTSSSCTTPLNYQLVPSGYSATTGTIEMNVMTNLSSTADTVLYLCYGNAAITTDQSTTAAWDSNYVAVYSLPNGSSLTGADYTSNGNTLTNSGSATATSGVADGAAAFNGTSNYLQAANSSSLGLSTMTLELWYNNTSSTTASQVFLDKRGASSGLGWGLAYNYGVHQNGVEFFIVGASTTADCYSWNGASAAPGWQQFAGTYDGTHVIAYINGQQNIQASGCGSSSSFTVGSSINTNVLYVGQRYTANTFTKGSLDEIRISNAARAATWLQTEYNNISSPSTFYSIGSQIASSSHIRHRVTNQD